MKPFTPEPIDQLRARFDAALQEVYHVEFLARMPEERPGLKPPHVFDHHADGHGWRLIVSVDQYAGRPYLHVSYSGCCGTGEAEALAAFTAVYNRPGVLRIYRSFVSSGGVRHLFFEMPEVQRRAAESETEAAR